MAQPLRIAIAGGSIGGLTAGVLLHELGLEVDIYERSAAALQARGAGIVVLPMTERYFVEKGGEDNRVSLELTWWKYVDAAGNELSSSADHFRFSSWNTIYRSLLDAFPPDRYHLGHEMTSFDQADGEVIVHFTAADSVSADLLICADGVASTARRLLLPDATPEYAGYAAWRGVAPETALPHSAVTDLGDAMLYQVLSGGHILVYAIPGDDGATQPGTRLQNFVWYRNYPAGAAFDGLMTDTRGERRTVSVPPGFVRNELLEELRTAAAALAPTIRQVVLAAPEPFVQAIFDLEVPRMACGRVVLLGDAAFSARPHVAAGTAKAAADAWALRDALRDDDDLDAALHGWEQTQLALGRSVVSRSREMGMSSQFAGTMIPGDPDWKFGLFGPGD